MPVTYSDGIVPDAALINAIQAGAIEVYATAADRDAESFVHGDVVFVEESGEVLSRSGSEWIVQAALPEQRRIVSHPSKIPLSASAGIVSTGEILDARRGGLVSVGGSSAPLANSGNVATGGFEASDFYAYLGAVSYDEQLDAYNTVDDLVEKYNYAMPTPVLNSGTTMVRFQRGFTEDDAVYETIVMVGVSSLIFPADLRCQVICIGSGGYGGAGGTLNVGNHPERSVVGGGGGGAGSLSSGVFDLRAGDLIEARNGGRIYYRGFPPSLRNQIFRDGVTLDSSGQASAVWRNGRLLGSAYGGSRGGSNPATADGNHSNYPLPQDSSREEAYYVSGGSGGGRAGNDRFFPRVFVPSFLAGEYRNVGGAITEVRQDPTRILAGGGGGGGARGAGAAGESVPHPGDDSDFQVARGGSGGVGVGLGWADLPERSRTICEGGRGGWAALRANPDDPDDNIDGEAFGRGAKGSTFASVSGVAVSENGGLNLSANRPGLGATLIRFRIDGGEFEVTDV